MPLSFSPLLSGLPTECRQGTNSPSVPRYFHTASPARVIMSMFRTTYSESVNSMPYFAIGLPRGPMQNGMMYMVRPCMQPLYRPFIVAFSSTGSIQWFVGPAASSVFAEIKVRASTRATSDGSERNKKLFSFFLSGIARPASTHFFIKVSYSLVEPSHRKTLSGSHISTHSLTHAAIFACLMDFAMSFESIVIKTPIRLETGRATICTDVPDSPYMIVENARLFNTIMKNFICEGKPPLDTSC